jgi:hypothetical protein
MFLKRHCKNFQGYRFEKRKNIFIQKEKVFSKNIFGAKKDKHNSIFLALRSLKVNKFINCSFFVQNTKKTKKVKKNII